MRYHTFDQHSDEVEGPFYADYVAGHHHLPVDSIQDEPLPPKAGHAVIAKRDTDGKAVGTQYVEDHRYKRVYHKETMETQDLEDLGPVPDGYTDQEPPGWDFHVWDEQQNSWVVDDQKKYNHDLRETLEEREMLYATFVHPLRIQAIDHRFLGDDARADDCHQRALDTKAQIDADNPLPTPLDGSAPVDPTTPPYS